MNKQRGSFYTHERTVRSVSRLPDEVWHSRGMRVEEEHARFWRHRYLPGLRQTNSQDKEGRT